MNLVSGVIPYGYLLRGPFHGETHSPGHLLQPSGLLFEQAAWVLMAELRRLNASGMFNTGIIAGIPSLNNYPDPRFPVFNVYEPSPLGLTLGSGIANPAFLLNLTNIGSIRNLMLALFFTPGGGLGADAAQDWFTETFRNHPRGTTTNPFFSQDIFAHPLSQVGSMTTGEVVTSTDQEDAFFSGKPYYPLGASGILYDIDIAELMYQPWPRLNTSAFSAGLSIFGGQSCPIFPQFQKTTGGLIAISNAGRSQFWNDGNFAIRGDILIPGTEALLTQVNDFDITNLAGEMTFIESGLAALPDFAGNVSTIAEAAFSPVGLPIGTYRIGVRLPRESNINVVIPSGVRSSVFPGINQPTDQGLHVFDDALFIETNVSASVLSPLTNVFKHDCLAELEANIGTPTWRQVMGLARLGTDKLVKTGRIVHQTAFDTLTGIQTVVLGFPVFDDVVNRTSLPSGSYDLPTDDGTGIPPFTNPDGFGSDGLILFSDLFDHAGDAYLIEDGFGRIHRFTGPPMAYADTIFNISPVFPHGASLNGDIWTFGNLGDNRLQNITGGGTLKTFDVATNFPSFVTTDIILHSAYQASSTTEVTDGIYVLWSARSIVSSPSPRTYRISRVIELSSTFEVQENITTAVVGSPIRDNTHIWYRTI